MTDDLALRGNGLFGVGFGKAVDVFLHVLRCDRRDVRFAKLSDCPIVGGLVVFVAVVG